MSRSVPLSLCLSLLLAGGSTGCSDDAGSGSSEDESDTDSDSSGPGPACGDGELDPGEECDDGNTTEGDGCSATCVVTSCGMRWSVQDATTTSLERGFDVSVAPDGSLYTLGRAETAPGEFDIWLGHHDETGLLWETHVDGGAGNDAGLALELAEDGRLFAAGRVAGDGDAIWFASFDAAGDTNWSQVIEGEVPEEDDRATGVALAPDGSVVVVGELAVADGSDVWLSKRAADTGAELWASTWSGAGDGNASSDLSGPVDVAPNGDIWVGAREFVDFETQDAALLRFDGDGQLQTTLLPLGTGKHQHDPVAVLATGDSVYYAVESTGAVYHSWLIHLDGDGDEIWIRDENYWSDIEAEVVGSSWGARSLDLSAKGELVIAGSLTNEDTFEALSWGEAWAARLDANGDYVCRSHFQYLDGMIIPPSLVIGGGGGGANGGAGLTGVLSAGQGPATWLWTGYFLE